MNKHCAILPALLALAGPAAAGGFDGLGQSVHALFEPGNYVEFDLFGGITSVTGTDALGLQTGDVGKDFLTIGGAFKSDINDSFSYALIFDQPFGAGIEYMGSTLAGNSGTITTYALTGLVRYKFDEHISIYGGPRLQTFKSNAIVPMVNDYVGTMKADPAFGYSVGAAYEVPEMAFRLALTYNSQVHHEMEGTEFGLATISPQDTPQSLNLALQTGIDPNTLLFASIRWVDWSQIDLAPYAFELATGQPLVHFTKDTVTYMAGVGRKLNERWTLLGSLAYEASTGEAMNPFRPFDGYTSLYVAGIYDMGQGTKIQIGLNYVVLGNKSDPAIASFSGNSIVASALRLSHNW